MKITVTTTDDKIFFLDVAEDLELENLKALCAMEIGSEVGQIMVIFNGRELSNDKNTLKQFGVRDGDCIVLERRRSNPNRIGEYPHHPHPPQCFTRCARVGLNDNESGSLNALSLSLPLPSSSVPGQSQCIICRRVGVCVFFGRKESSII